MIKTLVLTIALALGCQMAVAADEPGELRFNFKAATFNEVLDFFSRQSGLPVVKEVDVPGGTLDYLSPEAYNLDEGLRVLNIILQSRGVMLRRDADMLYLQSLTEMQRENIPTFIGTLPEEITNDQIVTIVRPLDITLAKPLAERLANLVAAYGSVTAMEAQNSLVITETAAQVRRLLSIIEELDREDPDGIIEIIPLRHTKAEAIMGPLTALLSTRVEKYVIGGDGKQHKIEEDTMPGLAFSPDPRTNSIIVKGQQARILQLRDTVDLLDVPSASSTRTIRTIELATVAPSAAARHLAALFATLPAPERPVIVQQDDRAAITLVGDEQRVIEATTLLRELDGDVVVDASGNAMLVLPLEHADPGSLIATLRSLLTGRQAATTRLVPGTDGRSLVLAGPEADVEAVAAIIPALDSTTADDRSVRLLRLDTPDAAAMVKAADDLWAAKASEEELVVSVDSTTRVVTMTGSPRGIESYARLLAMVEDATAIDRETRRVTIHNAEPSELLPTLDSIASQVLRAEDGKNFIAPAMSAVDAIDAIVITGLPSQVNMIASLASELDRDRASEMQPLRILQLRAADANVVAATLQRQYDARSPDEQREKPVRLTPDAATNTLIITAPSDVQDEISAILDELNDTNRLDEEGREIRIFPLTVARAQDLAHTIDAMFPEPPMPMDRRGRPMPHLQEPKEIAVRADTQTNSLIVDAPIHRMDGFEKLVKQLDTVPTSDQARDVHVVLVQNAEASDVAASLSTLFTDRRGVEQPPIITVDRASNALLVRATDTQFATIREVVDQLDEAAIASASQIRSIQIDPAKGSAREVAEALRQLLQRTGGARVEVLDLEDILNPKKTEPKVTPPQSLLPLPVHIAMTVTAFAPPASPASPDSTTPDEPDARIAVDDIGNSLVIVGSEHQVRRIQELIGQIVAQMRALPVKVRYIELGDRADAQALSNLLLQAMSQVTPAGGRRGDLRRRVAIVADRQANSLIIACNDTDFTMVTELMRALVGNEQPRKLVVRIYSLSTVTANRALAGINAMLDGTRRNRQASRMQDLAVELLGGDEAYSAVFNPDRIRVSADQASNTLIVTAPPEAIPFVDRFLELVDQSPVDGMTTLKTIPLRHADARSLQGTLQSVFRARWNSTRRADPNQIAPTFASDKRTNTLLVTASGEQIAEVEALVATLDVQDGEDRYGLTMIPLQVASPSNAANLLQRAVVGDDEAMRKSTLILPDDQASMLLVRADEETLSEIRSVVAEIDRDATSLYEVRTIALERADAGAVAQAIQQLYDDRARLAGGRRGQRRSVSVIGPRGGSTLLVAAPDEEFEQVRKLVEEFDQQQGADELAFKVFLLQHAQASAIQETVSRLVEDLVWSQPFFWGGGNRSPSVRRGGDTAGRIAVRADDRLNALIVTGRGDTFEIVQKLIDVLDMPADAGMERQVRFHRVDNVPVEIMAEVLRESFGGTVNRRWWQQGIDADAVLIRVDGARRLLIVSAPAARQDEITDLLASLDAEVDGTPQEVEVLAVQFADAGEISRTLSGFLSERARVSGSPAPTATIAPSPAANSLLVSASETEMATIRDLLTRLDQADVGGEQQIEIIPLRDGEPSEIARILREQFPRRGGKGVIVTPDLRTRSLIINAPSQQLTQVRSLISQLDTREASDETIIRTYTLTGARAAEAVRILGETLQLDSRGETNGIVIRLEDGEGEPVEVKARIVADQRSNSLIVTATTESFPIIEHLVQKLDDVPAASPREYHVIPLKHAVASDVYFTLQRLGRDMGGVPPAVDYEREENQLIIGATPEQYEQFAQVIAELDQPAEHPRVTDFIPLQFADAEQVRAALRLFYGPYAFDADTPQKMNVSIVADTSSNSLIISAVETEWSAIRALLEKLDSEEYDASLQLRVLPLRWADAKSVAKAINEAFQGRLDEHARQQQPATRSDDRERPQPPPTLVQADEWVRASAEPQTNSVVISANRQLMTKIEVIVTQLDTADFARLPAPRIISVNRGNPEQLAQTLRQTWASGDDKEGRDAIRIVADRGAGSIIVRAEETEWKEISALAEALQQEGMDGGIGVHVIHLDSANARRVASAITAAFKARAQGRGEPLSIEVDATGNNLIVAAGEDLAGQIRDVASQLDGMAPGGEHGVFIIDLSNITPAQAIEVIGTLGLNRPQKSDAATRLVSEPIRVGVLRGRNAVIVVAAPGDRDTVVALMKALDTEPRLAESDMRVIPLRNATANGMITLLRQVTNPAARAANTGLAAAVAEQVRRLALRSDDAKEDSIELDLSVPIRLIADAASNAVIVASTPGNVHALADLVALFDRVPVTESVTVQVFPLENIAADEFSRIVRDLFAQGKRLQRSPGSQASGVPSGAVGRALVDSVALAVDARTNTVIVAGREDAVAMVEVLSQRLDSDIASGWVETRLVKLRFADAEELATTLEAVLIEGNVDLPGGGPLQKQVGRLRIEGDGSAESDFFQPMSRLVIHGDEQLNSLLLVGTPGNLDVIGELVAMLDVEEASPGASVRIYPLDHAAAAVVASNVTSLFEQQVRNGIIRKDDRIIVQPDERTNSIIVSTSTRSFVMLEHLLTLMDAELPPELQEIRFIELEHASAGRLAPMLQQLMDARVQRLRRVNPETAELERVTILPDTRTNGLVVAAGNDAFEILERLADTMDLSTLEDASLVQVIPVPGGNVDRIAGTVRQIVQRRYAELPAELRASQQPLILTDTRSSSLLVSAGPEDVAVVEDLVRKLAEVPMNQAVGLHVLAVPPGSSAAQLGPRVQQLMRERQQSLGESSTEGDRVSVQADIASNTLIVAASAENMEVLENFMRVLVEADAETHADRQFDVITLRASRATDVVAMLNDLYVRDTNRARPGNPISVAADRSLNAVLVRGGDSDVQMVRSLVARLDGSRPAAVQEIRYIPLRSANAIETVSLIENVLSGRGIGRRRAAEQTTVLKYLGQLDGGEPDEVEVSSAIRETISLTPDLRTNTIIVKAPPESIELIEEMITDLDKSSTGSKTIRIFKLTNADATAMGEILADLFNLRQSGELLVLKPREEIGEPAMPDAPSTGGETTFVSTDLTAVPDPRQQLAITVDSRTNSLLVSGTPAQIDLVANVVDELDDLDANEREVLVYQLRNSKADEVAEVIAAFVDAEQRKLVETLSADQLGSASRLLEREVTIEGDTKSNTVLVSASPRYMDRVKEIIEQLDVDPPQVLIQVMLAEVTLGEESDWGVNLDRSEFGLGPMALNGTFGLAAGTALASTGVPSLAIASSDFGIILKALQSQDRLHVLSNPSVMAANNEVATIQVGETIFIPESTTFYDTGTSNTQLQQREVGVGLEVTPSINPDGFVRLDIRPELSALSKQQDEPVPNVRTPRILSRTADTTVTVQDGQTIVLGGLIGERYEWIEDKVPFFGDLPLIGALFRSETEDMTRTELLIVITPHVIRSPARFSEMDAITDAEIDRLSLPQRVRDQLRRSLIEGTGGYFKTDGESLELRGGEDEESTPPVSSETP
ncbi:MAG: secretin N-terminal domain-containing protein [Phycisphaerales bacterium]|nr:secretin N-terminal domain-containing protein [Phycisphaerales bacterium]